MIISVRVKPRSKKPGWEFDDAGTLVLRVHEPPVDGKANKAVMDAVAEIYNLARSQVRIATGETVRTKRVEIPDGSKPVTRA